MSMSPMDSDLPVLIAGAGPVGLVAAYTLAHHGIRCALIERNETTTKWPKMDITNARSMEILHRLGLAEQLREKGVSQDYSFDVIISTGLGDKGQEITRWKLPSPNEYRNVIKDRNDGSMPREPYQRCSQAIFEAWLKVKVEQHVLIASHWSMKLVDVQEEPHRIVAKVQDIEIGKTHTIECKYLIGCDGGGSVVRKTLQLGLTGGPLPAAMYLVHFRSRDLSRIHRQGQFWHIFFTHGGVIISQDEVDTWTTHLPVPLDFEQSSMDPRVQIYKVLGGQGPAFEIDVDEILVSSVWRPNNAIADRYCSPGGRAFIAGDAAHQNIPTGGYGMNTGLGDAYDIAWKLAMVLKGVGGATLLDSYENERRPVAIRNVQRAAEHMGVHQHYVEKCLEAGSEVVIGTSAESLAIKEYVKKHVNTHDGENRDSGIEMDYRLQDSPVIVPEAQPSWPEWTPKAYAPSTIPGSRAPHAFLKDGITSIYDLFGKEYTVVDFSKEGSVSRMIWQLAKFEGLPLTLLHLPDEELVRTIWQRDVTLVRPDHFVAWRATPGMVYSKGDLSQVLKQVFGRAPEPRNDKPSSGREAIAFQGVERSFKQDLEKVESLAAFQT